MKKEIKASIIRALIALVLLATLIFVIAYQNRDRSIKGDIIGIFEGSSDGKSRTVEGYAGGWAFSYGKKALLVTTNTLLLTDEDGAQKAADISFPSPAADTAGDYILVYDKSGSDFSVYSGTKHVYSKKTESSIIAGKINKNGYAVTACEVLGGKTELMVYNSDGEPIYVWTLASGEFVDMDISADNARMVISSVSNAEDELRGELTVVRLDNPEKIASGSETDEIYFKVKINRDYTVTALGSSKLDLYNSDGKRRWSLGYDGRTLLGADISDPDMMILCCESAASGLVGKSTEIELVNRRGEITASAVLDGSCERLSKNGELFAVSAGKRIYVYDKKCSLKNELVSDLSVRSLALFKSGNAAFVLSGTSASIVK